jgi:thiol-disulfide isomerase/thioredoxin
MNANGKIYRLLLFALVAALAGSLFESAKPLLAENRRVESVTIEDLQKKIGTAGSRTVVVVMAAWCAPCIEELPDLVDIHRKDTSDGLNLIGLSIDYSGPEALESILKEHRVTFPVYWAGEKAIEAYDIRKIPLLMLVKDGRVVERVVGMRPAHQLEAAIVDFIR